MISNSNWTEWSTTQGAIARVRPGYTVQHCEQYYAQHPSLDVATRSQHFVQHYAQYLISGYQALMR